MIKISLLIRSKRSIPPLFRYYSLLYTIKYSKYKIIRTNTILIIATRRSPSRLVYFNSLICRVHTLWFYGRYLLYV